MNDSATSSARVDQELAAAGLTARALREQAVLMIRCDDCEGNGKVVGLAIAHVTYVRDGSGCVRAMRCTRQADSSWWRGFLDDPSATERERKSGAVMPFVQPVRAASGGSGFDQAGSDGVAGEF